MSEPVFGYRPVAAASKRLIDTTIAVVAIVVFLPLFAAVTLAVRILLGSPAYFMQSRVGRDGSAFDLPKLRTLKPTEVEDFGLVASNSSRHLPFGAWLRRSRLDEWPQLVLVACGRMALVGPRPEVADWVEHYSADERRLLSLRPGLIDPATRTALDESQELASATDARRHYGDVLLPAKLARSLDYFQSPSLAGDFILVVRTAWALFFRRGA